MFRPKKWFFIAIIVICILLLGTAVIHIKNQSLDVQAVSENVSGESVQTLEELVSLGRKGDILISATNVSGFEILDFGFYYRHGHAAIIYSENEIIHCRGAGNVSELASLEAFGEMRQVRLYTVSGVSDDAAAEVADYAKENLLDIQYNFLADIFSVNTLNCTTIVYHAYLNTVDITFNNLLHTISPASFIGDEKTICLGNINWR